MPVNFIQYANKGYNCKTNYTNSNTNNVTFSGNIYKSSADMFFEQFNMVYPNKSISQFIKDIICSNDKNLIVGVGRQATAFRLPQMENYVVRAENNVLRNPENFQFVSFAKLNDLSAVYNFGLPIIKVADGVTIAKRVSGESHLGQNLIPEVDRYLETGYFSRDFSRCVLNELEEVSIFPISSYVDYARKVQFLNEHTNYKVDIKNPNNLMLDKQKREFNVIDFWQEEMNLSYPYNCAADMFLSILDFQRHHKYLEQLTPQEQERYCKSALQIIDKCQSAGRLAGIPIKSENVKKALIAQDEIHKPKISSLIGYNAIKDMYGDCL